MLHIIVALVLMQNVNSLDLEHKQTLNNMDKVVKIIKIINGVHGRQYGQNERTMDFSKRE